MPRFQRYSLRTTDLPAARAFYRDALDLELPVGPAPGPLEAWPLHERARAAGVPAHWLGQLRVEDPEALRDALTAAGGQALGPLVQGPHGRYATLRDPWGAIFAASDAPDPGPSPVAWHHLNVGDAPAARRLYSQLLGWDTEGDWAWTPGGPVFGGVSDVRARPGVHPHWLYFFPVQDVTRASERIRAAGGLALPPTPLGGRRFVACEDAQGAAFGVVGA